jgi:hypothetical protein
MDALVLWINGIETTLSLIHIDTSSLILDEFNPRIGFYKDNQPTEHLEQDQVVYALSCRSPDAYAKLKASIKNNRGAVNPIWVQLEPSSTRYRVIEGNTRVAIYRQLQVEEPQSQCWLAIPAYVLPAAVDSGRRDFIRLQSHLRGTTPWDAYEKAKYLYRLFDVEGWHMSKLEQHTKLTERQIRESIDAYQLMEREYLPMHTENPNEVAKFSYFAEYVKNRELQKAMKAAGLGSSAFCEWVANGKMIPEARDVRQLVEILTTSEARETYLRQGFEAAIEVLAVRKPYAVLAFYSVVQDVISGLKALKSDEVWAAAADDGVARLDLLRELADWSGRVVRMIESAQNGEQRP